MVKARQMRISVCVIRVKIWRVAPEVAKNEIIKRSRLKSSSLILMLDRVVSVNGVALWQMLVMF